MRIAVDVMGGDHGCEVIIAGVKQALQANAHIRGLFLVGNQDEIKAALTRVDCTCIITTVRRGWTSAARPTR